MKALLNSRLAVWAGMLAAAVIGWFTSHDIIAPPDAAQATGELTMLLQGVFAALAAVVLWTVSILAKKFSGGGSGEKGGTGSGGSPMLAAMTIMTWGVISMAGALLTSCGTLSLTSDGCVRSVQEREGATYTVDTCLGPDGKIDRVRLGWTNDQGVEIQANIYRDKRPISIRYKKAGLWLAWSEDAGISLGAEVPPEVATALEPEPPLPAKVVAGSAK